jgi:glycosyltransferase involved in cell wall biosynthesis
MTFPLSLLGWLLEPAYLRMLRNTPAITISESTKRDLARHGFDPKAISVIVQPVHDEEQAADPEGPLPGPVMLAFGAVRPMKRTRHVLRAFEIAKRNIPELRLVIAGDVGSRYGSRLAAAVSGSRFASSITVMGKLTAADRAAVFSKARVLCVASVKEGWCLVVTEASLRGVPAVAYAVDGVRDSIAHDTTGMLVSDGSVEEMAAAVVELCKDDGKYRRLRRAGIEWARTFTVERGYRDLVSIIAPRS